MKRLAVEVLRSASNASAGPSQRPICQLNCGIRKLSGYEISKPKSHRSISLRFNSSNAPARAPISSVNPLHLPAFETLASSLSSSQPCFGARGDEITILTSPVEFKAALLEMIKRARRRIIISSLYIGVEEEEIVSKSSVVCFNSSVLAGGSTQDRFVDLSTPPGWDHPGLSPGDSSIPVIEVPSFHRTSSSTLARTPLGPM